jgi:DNA-binding NtrC family response regulator
VFDLGSDLDRHIVIAHDLSVSRMHCRFEWRDVLEPPDAPPELWIVNCSKTNGTFVNDLKIDSLRLEDGAVIRVGRTSLVVFSEASKTRRVRDEWLIGPSPRFRSAVDRAFTALSEWKLLLLDGQRGTGRRAVVRALHELVCGPDTPRSEILCIADEHPRGPVDLTWKKGPTLRSDAGGGLLYLHELNAQPRAIQERFVRQAVRLTTAREVRCVISASEPGEFDVPPEALVTVTLPTLRERGPADISALIDHFLPRFLDHGRVHEGRRLVAGNRPLEHRTDPALPSDIVRALFAYDWPDNVAELAKTLERVAAMLRRNWNLHAAARDLNIVPGTLDQWLRRRGIPRSTEEISP